MSLKQTMTKQYQAIVDRATDAGQQLTTPREGWIATVRKAIGMSGAQLARRLDVSRARVSQAEKAELLGGVTLKALQAAAEAMGCRLVYAIVPKKGGIQDVVAMQARRKAEALVDRARIHMALEAQSLPAKKNKEEIERIASDLTRTMPSNLWTENDGDRR